VRREALVDKEVIHAAVPLEPLNPRRTVTVSLVDALRPEVARVG
jgi:hypothetical protein